MSIDRDALLVLLAEYGYDGTPDRAKLADAILALVRPVDTAALYNHGYVDGAYKADENLRKRRVVLTPEEKVVAAAALRWALLNPGEGETRSDWRPRFRALAERLEAAQ